MDTAAIALLGVAVGTFAVYLAVKRQWWSASRILALGSAVLLGLVTAGNHSRSEHIIVLAVSATLMAYFLAATAFVLAETRRRAG